MLFIRSYDPHFSAWLVLLCTKRKRNFLTEKPWWNGNGGISVSALLIAICLKGRNTKAIISIVLSQRQRIIYDQGGCWLWQGKKGEESQFFFKHHYVTGLASEVFYLLDNTLSVGVFTLIKLVFETQAAKLWQRGEMGRGKNQSLDLFKTWMQFFFSSYRIFWERSYEARGNDIHITKPLKPTNFNFPKWQTESFIPSKIINEILICVL